MPLNRRILIDGLTLNFTLTKGIEFGLFSDLNVFSRSDRHGDVLSNPAIEG
jgi:hypothetical protein